MPKHKFVLPPPARGRPGWTVASIFVHLAILAVIVVGAGQRYLERSQITLIQLAPQDVTEEREFALPSVAPETQPVSPPPTVRTPRVRRIRNLDTTRLATVAAPREVPMGVAPRSDSTTVIGTHRVLGPAFGEGRVWVRPQDAELGVTGPSPSVAAHVARIDSALRERILAYVDSMPRDSFAPPKIPKWTSEIDGQTWGIDSKWIYLGDLKLPAALLALLPFPQGNYYEAKAEQELQRVRTDIIRAARAAENAEDFKHYVEQVRKRKQEERDAERARKAAARDTVIP